MRHGGIEPTCAICDVPLHDDPHWSGELEAFCCEQHCDNEGCLNLPGGGFVPDDTASPATGDDSAHTQRRLPAAGKLPFPIATRLMSETVAIVRCQATTPNPLGRWGYCACTLEEGHDGPHLCQSVRHHEWESDSGRGSDDA